MIHATQSHLHWNYFLALERDLDVVSRYVEFCKNNLGVYSIELAHLLFAGASEVDVVAKLLCKRVSPTEPCHNIKDYRPVLLGAFPDLPTMEVFVPRYGLSFKPWENWASSTHPDWWISYNNVKHERDAHFQEATLQNALNALGALLILTCHHYSYALATGSAPLSLKDTTHELQPEPTLLRLHESHYHFHIVG